MKRLVIDIETTELEPWKGRIVAIGCRDTGSKKTMCFFDEDEFSLLQRFTDFYKNGGYGEIIGYNISFDIRFIFARCLFYNLPCQPLWSSRRTDVMDILRKGKLGYSYSFNKSGKLQDWVEFIFNASKLEKGDSVLKLYEKREFTRIINYCKEDVNLTYRLWERIQGVLWN